MDIREKKDTLSCNNVMCFNFSRMPPILILETKNDASDRR